MKKERAIRTRALVSENLQQHINVQTKSGSIEFFMPSARSVYEPMHLFDNEPETILWLDSLQAGQVLWDIGANIGVYSLYAAQVCNLRVVAFEPSAASYAVLAKNIEINSLDECVDAYCIALDDHNHLGYLHMAHTEAGHSMHAFDQSESVEGQIHAIFRQSVPGFSVDSFIDLFSPPLPDHIKLDVDSIEEKILKGAERTLRDCVKTILVEIDGVVLETGGAKIRALLGRFGFSEAEVFSKGARRNVVFQKNLKL